MLAVRRVDARLPWAALAVGLGAAVTLLPPVVSLAALAATGIGGALLVEPTLALTLMLAVAPLKTLIATEAPGMPLDPGQAALALAVGVWLLARGVRREAAPPRTRILAPLLLIMAAFAPSVFAAQSAGAWVAEFAKWVEIALLVVIVLDLGRAGRWEWIAFGAVLAAALQAAIGLWEFFGGSGAPHLWIAGFRHFRAFGTFGQPNPFSAYMGLTLPLALGLAWGYLGRAWRGSGPARRGPLALAALYLALSALLLAGLIASWGRGAWLGFAAALAVMVAFGPRRAWLGLALAGTGLLLALALWTGGLLPGGIQARLDNALTEFVGFRDVRGAPISDENFAIIERLAHWQAALGMADAHPWIGVGLGNYEAAYPAYRLPSWPRALGHAHNDYLNLLAETGVIGLAGYVAGWAALVWYTWRARVQRDPLLAGLALGLLGVWAHLAVHSVVDKLYVNNLFLHLGVLIGLLAIADRNLRTTAVNHAYYVN